MIVSSANYSFRSVLLRNLRLSPSPHRAFPQRLKPRPFKTWRPRQGGGAILAAMEWFSKRSDRVSRDSSLNAAIFLAVFGGSFVGLAPGVVRSGGLSAYVGYFFLCLGLVAILVSIRQAHAAVRRLVTESRNAL